MLSQDEQKQFARLVNAIIDIPLVPEEMEQPIFEHAVAVIDSLLEDALPPVFYEMLRNAEQGIDKDQAEMFTERLIGAVNKKLDLPYLNEDQEGQLLRIVISPLVKGMSSGKKLDDLLPIMRTTGDV